MIAPYIIMGEVTGARPIAYARAGETEAVSIARQLIGKGVKNVRIIDSVGSVYTSEEFHYLAAPEKRWA
jgi:hypothetical protein